MARTPKNSPRVCRASPATVGKITKKNHNLIANTMVETDASKSIVSSICTPRRMTRSVAKANHDEMPPPTSPLPSKKRKVTTSTKKSSAVKQENEAKKFINKGRKSLKLFAENVATESDSDDGLPSVSILNQYKTPVVKIERIISAELAENKSLTKQQSSGKKGRQSKRTSNNASEAEPRLNTTFEMDTENEGNIEKSDLSSACKTATIKNRISVIDLTESPMAMKSTSAALNTTFSPLANILEESEVKLNDETFTEVKSKSTADPVVGTGPTPKSAQTVSSKSTKKASLQLKRLQAKTPLKTISETRSQTPINGILKSKPMSSAKKAKVLQAAKVVIMENEGKKPTGTAKKTPSKNDANDTEKSSAPFQFGAPENKSRGFNFNLKGTKIPTWKELEKQKEQEKNAKSDDILVTKSTKKTVPNFKAIHERMFEKDLALDAVEDHKTKRANFIRSNKKINNEENIFKPADPKSKRKLNLNNAQAKKVTNKSAMPTVGKPVPLKSSTTNNRAQLNGEQREERRKMMFKQSGKRSQSKVNEQKVTIKGVRTNRRFDLMMENRYKSKN